MIDKNSFKNLLAFLTLLFLIFLWMMPMIVKRMDQTTGTGPYFLFIPAFIITVLWVIMIGRFYFDTFKD